MLDDVISLAVLFMGKTAGFSSPQEARRNAEIPIKEQIPFFCMMASRYPKYILIYGVVVAGVLYNCIDSNFIPPNGMLFTFFYKQLHWIPQRAEPEPIPHTPYLYWILWSEPLRMTRFDTPQNDDVRDVSGSYPIAAFQDGFASPG